MSNAIFPSLVGLSFPVKRAPQFNTIVQQAASGREVRAALRTYALWDWELCFDYLSSAAAIADWQNLLGFYLQRQGSYDAFLFNDTDDNTVTGQFVGTGDGTTVAFQLIRTLGGALDLVTDLNGAPVIKNNGSIVSSGNYTVGMNSSGIVTFNTAPLAGHAITWTGSYYWRVRFKEDSNQYEKFANQFWENKSISFVTARP